MSRTYHMVGNWKMNQNLGDIENFFSNFSADQYKCETWLAPQAIHIPALLKYAHDKNIKVGGQDCSNQEKGAFTGQTSAHSLKDLGAHFTLVGHSERRTIQKESNELLNEKTKNALAAKLKVIYCIGETLEERESDKTIDVVKEQLTHGLKGLSQENILIAYEPVWAIGTGKTATPEQANEVHAEIRKTLKNELGWDSDNVVILYGGSVKPSNVKELLGKEHIDGALVGGASLKAEDFSSLCQEASK